MAIGPPLLFALPGSQEFGERLAVALDAEIGELSTREFPDGESYVRLETDPAGREVCVVATLPHPNEKILPLLFVTGAARQLGAARVGIVAPYLAYMRQDARFQPGEAITARLFARIIDGAADWLLTVDPHLHRIASLDELYTIPATAVHVTGPIGAWISANVSQPLIVGPDEESRQWVTRVAESAGAPFVVLAKVRRGDERVDVTLPELAGVDGRTPVLVDDIISTGRTLLAAVQLLREHHPELPPPVCVGVHALFSRGAYEELRSAGAARVVSTNSVPHPSNAIDIVPTVANALRAAPVGFP